MRDPCISASLAVSRTDSFHCLCSLMLHAGADYMWHARQLAGQLLCGICAAAGAHKHGGWVGDGLMPSVWCTSGV